MPSTTPTATAALGMKPTPLAAAADSASSLSSSRRRRPNSPKAIPSATAPVVVTRVGPTVSPVKCRPLEAGHGHEAGERTPAAGWLARAAPSRTAGAVRTGRARAAGPAGRRDDREMRSAWRWDGRGRGGRFGRRRLGESESRTGPGWVRQAIRRSASRSASAPSRAWWSDVPWAAPSGVAVARGVGPGCRLRGRLRLGGVGFGVASGTAEIVTSRPPGWRPRQVPRGARTDDDRVTADRELAGPAELDARAPVAARPGRSSPCRRRRPSRSRAPRRAPLEFL